MAGNRQKIPKSTLVGQKTTLSSPHTSPGPTRTIGYLKKVGTKGTRRGKEEKEEKEPSDFISAQLLPGSPTEKDTGDTLLSSPEADINHARGSFTGEVSIAPGSGIKTSIPIKRTQTNVSTPSTVNGSPTRTRDGNMLMSSAAELSQSGLMIQDMFQPSSQSPKFLDPTTWSIHLDIIEKLSATLGMLIKKMDDHKKILASLNTTISNHLIPVTRSFESLLENDEARMRQLHLLDSKIAELMSAQEESWVRASQASKDSEEKSHALLHQLELQILNLNLKQKDDPSPAQTLTHNPPLSPYLHCSFTSEGGSPNPGSSAELTSSRASPGKKGVLLEVSSPVVPILDELSLDFIPIFFREDGYESHSFNINVFLNICQTHWRLRSVYNLDIRRIQYFSNDQDTTTSRFTFCNAELRNTIWDNRDHFLGRGLDMRVVNGSPSVSTSNTMATEEVIDQIATNLSINIDTPICARATLDSDLSPTYDMSVLGSRAKEGVKS